MNYSERGFCHLQRNMFGKEPLPLWLRQFAFAFRDATVPILLWETRDSNVVLNRKRCRGTNASVCYYYYGYSATLKITSQTSFVISAILQCITGRSLLTELVKVQWKANKCMI